MLGILPSAVLASQSEAVAQQEKPNFVFFMAEDLARECFSLYNGHAARTPELDKLAADGIVFNNAYSCAPVSSAARSSLITGCYAPSMGLSWHRKIEQVELPQDMHLFPYYLRQAGYFTSNGFKTDYICRMEKGAWSLMKAEMDGWRNRPEGAPFFHCFTTTSAMKVRFISLKQTRILSRQVMPLLPFIFTRHILTQSCSDIHMQGIMMKSMPSTRCWDR